MTDDNEAIINRLFDITERYECLLLAVKEQSNPDAIQQRAWAIEQERGYLREGRE